MAKKMFRLRIENMFGEAEFVDVYGKPKIVQTPTFAHDYTVDGGVNLCTKDGETVCMRGDKYVILREGIEIEGTRVD